MKAGKRWIVQMDEQGHLILPPELQARFRFLPGDQMSVWESQDSLTFYRPVDVLARINLEVTNQCNLSCLTCVRNVWDEPEGVMSEHLFSRFLKDVEKLEPKPQVFFGGFGEPLSHPDILQMLKAVKETGASVELITNGTLLDEKMAGSLIEIQLDRLWVSLDGAHPKSYADIRLGSKLKQILHNMKNLYHQRTRRYAFFPRIGVAFVAMQRNICDLLEVIQLSLQFGADQFSISNVLAFSPELQKETLYAQSMYDVASHQNSAAPHFQITRMDLTGDTQPVLGALMKSGYFTNVAGSQWRQPLDLCPFLAKGSTSIRWDGLVSPCLPLLHSHESYLDDRLRVSRGCTFGSLLENDLMTIWMDEAYADFRRRLQSFDFSPCVMCNSCEMANNNDEDCFGNSFPTCGGCLWAQGLILCP